MKRKNIFVFLMVAILGLSLSSCLVAIRPPVFPGVIVVGPPLEYGYQPLLYNGYVVYYSDDGVPFYWSGSSRVWVPVASRNQYIVHYRSHHRSYRHWHKHRGHHYQGRRYRANQKALKKTKRKPNLKKAKPQPSLKKVEAESPYLKPAEKKSKKKKKDREMKKSREIRSPRG